MARMAVPQNFFQKDSPTTPVVALCNICATFVHNALRTGASRPFRRLVNRRRRRHLARARSIVSKHGRTPSFKIPFQFVHSATRRTPARRARESFFSLPAAGHPVIIQSDDRCLEQSISEP
jgi:hypothetical protein